MHTTNRIANFACRMLDSMTKRMTRSTVRLCTAVSKTRKARSGITDLSLGASFGSHFAATASACKHTSTSLVFRSSAIAFVISPMCDLYNAGQCFDT